MSQLTKQKYVCCDRQPYRGRRGEAPVLVCHVLVFQSAPTVCRCFRTQLLTVMLIYNIDYVANVKCISNIMKAAIYLLLYAIDVLSLK